ncbi:MAG: biotin/lipoyl-containing protein [Hydrogenoanaerobacterium sp.]
MKRMKVTVNGNVYDVQVEELGAGAPAAPIAPPVAAPAPVAAAPAPVQVAAPAPAAAPAPVAAGAEKINSPMPGTIVKVNVAAGQAVKKGDVLVVLEAMKMENDIMSPRDGTVAGVHVTQGAAVNSNDPLVSLS